MSNYSVGIFCFVLFQKAILIDTIIKTELELGDAFKKRAGKKRSGRVGVMWGKARKSSRSEKERGEYKSKRGTSMVAQWLRIHLPMQGTRV